jgi:two-component system, NtrC family, response regulator AtoC
LSRHATVAGETPSRSTAGKTVVLIDDEDELRQEIAEYLERRGYEVLQCDSANAARRLIGTLVQSAKAGVVVFCDEQLPDGDGIDIFIAFAARLPASRWFLMSGCHDSARLAEYQRINGKLPPYAVLEKPFTLRSLRIALGEPETG